MYLHYPFYFLVRGIGVVDAYHSHPTCPIGQSIAPAYRQAGNRLNWPECTFYSLLRTPLGSSAPPTASGLPVAPA